MNTKYLILGILILYTKASFAEIYKWVDGQGRTHYGDKPIVNAEELDVDISKKGHIKINDQRSSNRQKLLETYDDEHKRENKQKTKHKKIKKDLERKCALSTDRLRRYERASSLYNLDKEGNRVTIPSVEKDRQTNQLKKNIAKYCKK